MDEDEDSEEVEDGEDNVEDVEIDTILHDVAEMERSILEGRDYSSDEVDVALSNVRQVREKRRRGITSSSSSNGSVSGSAARRRCRIPRTISPPPTIAGSSCLPPPGVEVDEFGLPLPSPPANDNLEDNDEIENILSPPIQGLSQNHDPYYIQLCPLLQ